jgi:hypothetical protein
VQECAALRARQTLVPPFLGPADNVLALALVQALPRRRLLAMPPRSDFVRSRGQADDVLKESQMGIRGRRGPRRLALGRWWLPIRSGGR